MITKEFRLIIKVDEKNISKKYPNFNLNYTDPNHFISQTIKGRNENNYKEFGYSIEIQPPKSQSEIIQDL